MHMNIFPLPSTAPEPVTLAEAKVGARLDADDHALDDLVLGCISAAREQAEHITGRQYQDGVVRVELVDFPAPATVLPLHAPRACAVSYWTGSAWSVLDPASYVYASDAAGTMIASTSPAGWPVPGFAAVGPRVRLDFTAGPATAADVPAAVKLYIKASVSAWVNNPDAADRKELRPNPLFERLLDGPRLWR